MQELNVRNVIIGKQFETCDNYQNFIEIVRKKKINVFVVEGVQRIKIENNLYFDILWPSSDHVISENMLNNNSLVCKLVYQKFSMLFTGDIEEIAEKAIAQKYQSNDLKADILKVAHHGSKTSSTKELIEAVKPKIALIGVGERNNFGHPNQEVLKRIEQLRYKDL